LKAEGLASKIVDSGRVLGRLENEVHCFYACICYNAVQLVLKKARQIGFGFNGRYLKKPVERFP